MKISVSKSCKKADLVVVPVYNDKKLASEAKFLGKDIINKIKDVLGRDEYKAESFDTRVIYSQNKSFPIVELVGLGKKKDVTRDNWRELGSISTAAGVKHKASFVVCVCPSKDETIAAAVCEGIGMGTYSFERYLTDKKAHKHKIKESQLIGDFKASFVKRSQALSEAMLFVRDLGNTPAIDMTPDEMGRQAKKLADSKIKVKLYKKKDLLKLKMGAFLGVNAGSDREPCMAVLEYKNSSKKKSGPICLVGKGITFDAGGIDLKPSGYLFDMKMDMLGAATVLGVFKALKSLKPKAHVVGVIGCTENMLGGSAYKPSDILKSYSGKTIEIYNTDAEGRLVLADALAYAAKKYKPRFMIDIATLTGACLHALGSDVCAVMGNDDKLVKNLLIAAQDADEMLWELPMPKHYLSAVKGKIADVKNLSQDMYAGTIMAGAFLREFVGECKWAHLDIAGTGMVKKPAFKYLTPGASGRQVRTLYRLIEMEG